MIYPLHYASRIGSIGTVGNLLRQGMQVNVRDRNGFTPLMKAVTYRRSNVVNKLINSGANVNSRMPNGTRPVLHFALLFSSPQILKKLIDAGARINRNNITANTTHYLGVGLSPEQHRILMNAKERLNLLNRFRGGNNLGRALRTRTVVNRFHPYRRN
jgi:ankyrin repeat protein